MPPFVYWQRDATTSGARILFQDVRRKTARAAPCRIEISRQVTSHAKIWDIKGNLPKVEEFHRLICQNQVQALINLLQDSFHASKPSYVEL